jgi:hypothetical protein
MPDFVCPICASVNWRDVVVPKGGGYYKTDFFECCGCTAMFRKPDLFTVGRGQKKSEPGKPYIGPGRKAGE